MSRWSQNLKTDDERTRFENSVLGAKSIISRLYDILEEEESEIDRSELTLDTYSTPNWAEKQAHKNGQRAILRKIKNIINLDQQRDKETL